MLGITRNMLRTQLKRHGLLGANDAVEGAEVGTEDAQDADLHDQHTGHYVLAEP